MPVAVKLSKADVRRALALHHFTPCATQMDAFERLRSVQFDPIAPVGCNHDLVLQARVPGYRVGDWEKTAYEDRLVYDGWDKQASLVPFEGWPWRRLFYELHGRQFEKFMVEHTEAIRSILSDIETRGPLMPKEFEFQERRAEWKSTWYSPNVTKRVLRALWHTGRVMTAGRRKGQHLYDLTERIVPSHLQAQAPLAIDDAKRELVLERHRAVGILRPSAAYEVWSYSVYAAPRVVAINELIATGELLVVDVEGVKAHATPSFLSHLDSPAPDPRVVFVAPLDQLVWDRKMIAHLFEFDYAWEIYIPEAKRRWGYYVLPVLFGDGFAGRAEFYCRGGVLELRQWFSEPLAADPRFLPAFGEGVRGLMNYCRAKTTQVEPHIEPRIRSLVEGIVIG